jgi:hypothetical protein
LPTPVTLLPILPLPILSVSWRILARHRRSGGLARMKLVQEFRDLLQDKVNLDDTRLTQLDDRVTAVFNVLKTDNGIGSYIKDKIPQGSWAHKTIIKPTPGQEFDADFLVRMEEVTDWHDEPVEYLKYLLAVLESDGTYAKMPVSRKRRCVRLAEHEQSGRGKQGGDERRRALGIERDRARHVVHEHAEPLDGSGDNATDWRERQGIEVDGGVDTEPLAFRDAASDRVGFQNSAHALTTVIGGRP